MELARDRDDVQGAGAARRDQCEVARIVALRHRDFAHGERHLGDGDFDDGLRRRDRVHLQGAGDFLLDAAPGGVGIELHLAAQKIVGIEPPQHHIGVGDGGLQAAAAVADRAGIGAGALRPDLERAHVVEPGDRAAARADLDHVDHRQHHRMAAGVTADIVARRHGRLALAHQAGLRRCAAHVERDDVAKAERAADLRRGDDAADRAGFHHRHRALGRDLRRHHAAVRAHDREITGKADLAEALREARHVAADLRPDVGVDHRGRHPLELAVLAQDLVRQRQVRVGDLPADHLAGDLLVLGVDVGVQEADGDRLDPVGAQRGAGFGDAGAIERHVHLARAQQPLVDLAREVARHQRPVTVKEQAISLRPVAAADDVYVARAAGDHEAGLGAFSLDQRVDGDGRAVDQLVDGGGGKSALADAVDDALPELRRGGEALGLHEATVGVVEPDQIGEGASDIDGDDKHAWRLQPTASQDLRRARDTQRIFNVVRDCRIAPAVGRR